MSVTRPLPNIGQLLRPLAEKIPADQQPLFIAIVERMAAQRYRRWADEINDAKYAGQLRECADREEEIAGKIEALYPNASELVEQIRSNLPDLDQIVTSLYDDLSILEQYAAQAEGERIGAATWRGFAQGAERAKAEVFNACATLEEASAEILEEIIEAGG